MGIMDKITGKAKQAAGDLTGDAATRREGVKEERKGEAKDQAARAEETAEAKQAKADRLERETS